MKIRLLPIIKWIGTTLFAAGAQEVASQIAKRRRESKEDLSDAIHKTGSIAVPSDVYISKLRVPEMQALPEAADRSTD